MRGFRDRPIRLKLTVVIMAASGIALLVASLFFAANDVGSIRHAKTRELTTLAQIIGANAAAAVEFSDDRDATEILAALRARPLIETSAIYRKDGTLLAQYVAPGAGQQPPPRPGEDGHEFLQGGLTLFHPILLDDQRIGTVYLRASLSDIALRLREYGGISILILIGSVLVAYLVAARLQHLIADPIVELARTATAVSKDRNYSLRARRYYADEVGELIDRFNEMLAQIETQDAALREASAQAHESEQRARAANESKSVFLARMSHELRTPLNAIIGYSEMLQEEAEDLGQDEFLPDLQKINGAGKHLLALINDILDLSKIEAGKMELYLERFELRPVIDEVVATIQPLVSKNGNRLEVRCADDAGTVYSDLTKTRQILFNLLSNACKFTENGTVTLEAARERGEAGHRLVLSVADTGIGMTREQAERIFEAFMQADASTTRKHGGTGLGLAITRRFCEMMGGEITLESEPGRGSVFTVRLPAEVKPQPEKPADSAASRNGGSAPAPAPGGCVLAIDDEPDARDLLERLLRKHGFEVMTAGDGEEGLRLARERRPAVITLDVMMPKMDGWAVLSALKADPELADIPVVMISMLDSRDVGFALGANEYLTKPIERDRLVELLRKYRESGAARVLIVEDDADLRDMLRRVIEKEGSAAAEAENGRVALERMGEHVPSLILLDLMMPEMDGFQFLEELRKHPEWRAVPVVVITARTLSDEDRRRLNGGVESVLDKGAYSREELLGTIRELMGRRDEGTPAGA